MPDGMEVNSRYMPEGESLGQLGIDIDDIVSIGGISLVGGGMWGETPPPEPMGAVIMVAQDMDGKNLDPMALIMTARRMRRLRDKFYEVFTLAAEAAEEMFENGGELSVAPEA